LCPVALLPWLHPTQQQGRTAKARVGLGPLTTYARSLSTCALA